MRGDEHPERALLRRGRARAIERLTNAFTRDELGLDEFEERLNRAYAAQEGSALEELVQDLSPEAIALQAEVSSVLGSVEIIVPPNLAVESDGSSIGRRHPARAA